jgi:hypothetical protein
MRVPDEKRAWNPDGTPAKRRLSGLMVPDSMYEHLRTMPAAERGHWRRKALQEKRARELAGLDASALRATVRALEDKLAAMLPKLERLDEAEAKLSRIERAAR